MAQFRIDQATPGAGTAGQTRHDLIPSEEITLVATSPTGGGVSYTWEILDKVGSNAVLSATTGSTVTIGTGGGPITSLCAFFIRLTANDNGTVTVTERIASFEWDLPELQKLHLRLSDEMNREAQVLAALDTDGNALPSLPNGARRAS